MLPTGGGKSVCYQVPALMLDGFCLVISPLIALMQDQVARLKQMGIMAECIHSGMHFLDVKRVLENMLHGPYKLLYVSPERLQTDLFKEYLPEFNISFIAVDEAHCISQWGHDFRPDYLKIAEVRAVFNVPVLALTATATPKVQEDIAKQLQLKNFATFKTSGKRDNIFYHIKYSENKPADTLRAAEEQTCGIVYCRSRKQTEATARNLEQSGVNAAFYHAGLPKELRGQVQESWTKGRANIIVATTAFGMGIDKPDVRMVLHYDSPEHLEAYYQEAGRAGRDGKPSEALALYNTTDIKRLQESIITHFPPEEYLKRIYQAVAEYLQVPIGNKPEEYFSFDLQVLCRYFHFDAISAARALKLLEQEGLWTLTEAVFKPATVKFVADRSVVESLATAYPDLHYACIILLRLYSGIFQYPVTIRINQLANQLKIEVPQVEMILAKLHEMEIIEYLKPKDGPQLMYHHIRVDSRHLLINMQRINELKKHHEERTNAMISFLENTTECRERILLEYFGENVLSDCGHCDVCREKNRTVPNFRQIRQEILKALSATDKKLLAEIIAQYPETYKKEVIAALRKMVDERLLTIEGNIVKLF